MRKERLLILIVISLVALVHRSDGQQTRPLSEQLKLATVMPKGAIVYLQTNDLSALLKTWLASPVRSQFYDSASFAAFEKSHAYLKLQDRKKEFETAIGIGLDEKRLAELAGRTTAVSIYDIGKLEMVFVTEIPRARAIATTLFKQAPQFQERSADGTSYFVHDVNADGGRLNQQFCFAYVEDKLILTTTEGLMIRAIANSKNSGADSLSSVVFGMAEQANGFAAHDATMWLDQAALNRNRYFSNYWIHHNIGELANIETALVDLRISRQGMTEQRWFKTTDRSASGGELATERIAGFVRFAPTTAQLIQIRAGTSDAIASSIEESLFGTIPQETWSPPEAPDKTRSETSGEQHTREERYSKLDSRFDIDVDDEQAPKRGPHSDESNSKPGAAQEPSSGAFTKSMSAFLSNVSSGSYCELACSRTEAGKPFVRFERAIIVQLKLDSTINRQELERAVVAELRARFVVNGTQPRLEWQDEGALRFVSQSLLEQGAAYSVAGDYLVLASSREFANEILQSAKATPTNIDKTDVAVEFFGLIRVAGAKPSFDALVSKLDGAQSEPSRKKNDDEAREVKFFSENVSSLVAASAIREVRLTRQSAGSLKTENIIYSW